MEQEKFPFIQGKLPKFLISFASILAMGVVLYMLFPIWGQISGIVMAIPVIIISWLIGWQAGLVASSLSCIVIWVVFSWSGDVKVDSLIAGLVLTFGVSALVGWTRNIYNQLQKHLDELLQNNRNLSHVLSETEEFSDALIKQTAELSKILDASKAMSSTLDLEKVIRTIAMEITSSLDASGCAISNWDKASNRVVTWIEHRSVDLDLADNPGDSYALDEYPSTKEVLEEGKTITIYSNDSASDPIEVEHIISKNTTSLLMMPVKFEEEVLGLLEVDDIDNRQYTEEDVNTCLKLTEQAGIAIHNARLFEEIRYKLKEQTLLTKAVTTITSSLDPNIALQLLCEQLCVALNATSVYISTFDESTNYSTVIAEFIGPQASEREKESDLGKSYLEDDQKFLEFIQTGVPTIDQFDSPDLGILETEHMSEYGARTILYLPLRIKGVPKGYIEVWESRRNRIYSDTEINLGRAIAEHAAVALENAYLHKKATEAELRFKSIAKNSPDNILLLDKDLNICYVNFTSPGLTVEQVIGTPLYSYAEADQQQRVKDTLQGVLETAKPDVYETEYLDSNGGTIYYESRVSPLLSDDEVSGLVVSSRDISNRKEMEMQLEYLAMHDPLTGLPNRRFLEFRLSETMKLVERQKLRLEVAILDLDNFKDINDSYGHAIGDQILAELGKRLKDNIRGSDFAARFGGDEFIVLFVTHRNTPEEKLHERFESIFNKPISVQDHIIQVRASIGYSCYKGDEETDIGDISQQADSAMYRAKSRI